jgi:PIN domain nuclease of toxin-antitoxin system
MRLLLDTHTFIWWSGRSARLSPHALSLCGDPANTLLLSVVSVWEIQIKQQAGKLQLTMPLAHLIAGHQQSNSLQILPIELTHVFALDTLPMHHRDPFDRLLIAQAHVEGTVLVSHDAVFAQYPVDVQW